MNTVDEALTGKIAQPAPKQAIWLARGVPLLAGLAQGATVYWNKAYSWPDVASWPDEALQDAALIFVLAATLVIQMTWPRVDGSPTARHRSLGSAVLTGLLLALCHYWSHDAWKDADIGPNTVFLGLALFLALPLLQGLVEDGLRLPSYDRLFGRFVDVSLAILIGLFSLGIYVLLRVLWAELFDLLGLTTVTSFLRGSLFASFPDAMAWALGISVTRERDGILDKLLRLCTALARGLLPVIVLIGGSFFLALPFTGLDPVWRQGGSGLLLTIAGFAAIFINGVYQTGGDRFPAWQKRLVEVAILIVATAVGLAAYGTARRVLQYGLTPDRVLLLASVVTAALVAGGYVLSVIPRRGPWLGGVARVNRLTLPAIILLLIALASPVLDPVALSAWSQYRRMANQIETAKTFDFGYLQFRLGPAGRERLIELENLAEHPDISSIHKRIAEARQSPSYWDWLRRYPAPTVASDDDSPPQTGSEPSETPPRTETAPEPLERATKVTGPIALQGTTKWHSGATTRLFVVVTGYVGFLREGEDSDMMQYAAVFRAEPDEMITLEPSGRATVLIVELEPAP